MKSEISAEESKIIHLKSCLLDKEEEEDGIFEAAELPCAPTPEKNNDEAVVINSDSPLTWLADSDNEAITDLDSSPQTPKSAIFDSFLPGPDELILAPLVKKQENESKFSVARRLNFDSLVEVKKKLLDDDDDDDVLLDTVYKSLLDVIVSKQTEEGVSAEEEDCSGYKTPTRVPLLTGIAETCPDAPKKSRPFGNVIHLGLCRKLDFSEYW